MLLQHDLNSGRLAVPNGRQVFFGLKSGDPDVDADGESEERGEDDARNVEFQVGSVALEEDGGDAQQEGNEHQDRVDHARCGGRFVSVLGGEVILRGVFRDRRTGERTVVQEHVRGDVVHIGVVLDIHASVQGDEEMQAGAQEEDDVEADENEEDLVRHRCAGRLSLPQFVQFVVLAVREDS